MQVLLLTPRFLGVVVELTFFKNILTQMKTCFIANEPYLVVPNSATWNKKVQWFMEANSIVPSYLVVHIYATLLVMVRAWMNIRVFFWIFVEGKYIMLNSAF